MEKTRIRFLSGELYLEGILAIPDGKGPFAAVIVCHPHPLYGGSMGNNVVSSLAEELTRASFISLKFNFRGVGGSQGTFGQGIGEQKDVAAAISFVTTVPEANVQGIGLVGYSAGAGFCLPVCVDNPRIKSLAVVSPPLSLFDFGFLEHCSKPKLIVCGSRDDFTSVPQFLRFCRSLPAPNEYEVIDGACHFWWGYESVLAAKAIAFFSKTLSSPSQPPQGTAHTSHQH